MEFINLRIHILGGVGLCDLKWEALSHCILNNDWRLISQYSLQLQLRASESLISKHHGLASYTHMIYMIKLCMLANDRIIIIILIIMIMKRERDGIWQWIEHRWFSPSFLCFSQYGLDWVWQERNVLLVQLSDSYNKYSYFFLFHTFLRRKLTMSSMAQGNRDQFVCI